MRLEYALMDPTGNQTILCKTAVPEKRQPEIAAFLMQKEPSAEQVGFLSEGTDHTDVSLRMAGGEFCGNATMSAAALYCLEHDLSSLTRISVSVSGAEQPVPVILQPAAEAAGRFCTVEMPRPQMIGAADLCIGKQLYTIPIVRFSGITHLILEQSMEKSFAENAVKKWCGDLGCDGLGLMLTDRAAGTLTPLVYVPAADTLFWESSCASGTTAAGLYFSGADRQGNRFTFREPAGSLTIEITETGTPLLSGTVKLLSRGIAEF